MVNPFGKETNTICTRQHRSHAEMEKGCQDLFALRITLLENCFLLY